ncbi:hypothetical protein [Streptomyces asiaticus]|uniref:hypothetical protein n=1 Tax=Streptomyces asiaticus TaxID=114695 RepID=UPI0037FBE7AD
MDLSQVTPIATLVAAGAAVGASIHATGAAWRREQTDRQYEALSNFFKLARTVAELDPYDSGHSQQRKKLKDSLLILRLTGVPPDILKPAREITNTFEKLSVTTPIPLGLMDKPYAVDKILSELQKDATWMEDDDGVMLPPSIPYERAQKKLQALYDAQEKAEQEQGPEPDPSAARHALDEASYDAGTIKLLTATKADRESHRGAYEKRRQQRREQRQQQESNYRNEQQILNTQVDKFVETTAQWLRGGRVRR